MLPKELEEKLCEVELAMNHGDIDYGLALLEELCRTYPDNYHVFSLLGECYLAIGHPEKAIKPLQWATKIFPHERVKTSKPGAPSMEAEKDESIFVKRLKKSLRRRNILNLWVDHYLLGCAYSRCVMLKKAMFHLNMANRMNPHHSDILRNIGWIRCMQGKKEMGRKLLKRSIDLDPKNALAYNDLGASFLFEEELDEAKKWIEKALQIDPEDTFIRHTANKLEEFQAYKKIFGRFPEA